MSLVVKTGEEMWSIKLPAPLPSKRKALFYIDNCLHELILVNSMGNLLGKSLALSHKMTIFFFILSFFCIQ